MTPGASRRAVGWVQKGEKKKNARAYAGEHAQNEKERELTFTRVSHSFDAFASVRGVDWCAHATQTVRLGLFIAKKVKRVFFLFCVCTCVCVCAGVCAGVGVWVGYRCCHDVVTSVHIGFETGVSHRLPPKKTHSVEEKKGHPKD